MRNLDPVTEKASFTAEEVKLLMANLPQNRIGATIHLILHCVLIDTFAIVVKQFPQKSAFPGRFENCSEMPKKSQKAKEKVPKPYDFETSLVEISGIEPLTS